MISPLNYLDQLFLKISPPCNTSTSNKRNESGVSVCSSYRSDLERTHLGKIYPILPLHFLIDAPKRF